MTRAYYGALASAINGDYRCHDDVDPSDFYGARSRGDNVWSDCSTSLPAGEKNVQQAREVQKSLTSRDHVPHARRAVTASTTTRAAGAAGEVLPPAVECRCYHQYFNYFFYIWRRWALLLSLLVLAAVVTAGVFLAVSEPTYVRSPSKLEERESTQNGAHLQTNPSSCLPPSCSSRSSSLGQGRRPPTAVPAPKVRARNEYGEYDEASLKLYGLDMVVEPYRATTFTIDGMEDGSSPLLLNRFLWRLQYASHDGIPLENTYDAWTYDGGPQVTVTLDRPGTIYLLSVENVDESGAVVAAAKRNVSCKYVRRELRALTEDDREAFFYAMLIWYSVSTEEGREKYGPDFDNYQRVTAVHNAQVDNFCYHVGLQFLTSHPAFDLTVERYLQMIDPRVSLPMWDYMIDGSLLGDKWYESIIFDKNWFGSALGSPDNSFIVSEGRFSNISTIYDPEGNLVDSSLIKPYHDAFGYVNAPNNYQGLPKLSRTSSFCGLTSHALLPTPQTFIGCFEEQNTLLGWETCMETNVHGDLHGLLGGAFDCNTDMKAFSEEHREYSLSLLSFVLEYMTFNYWPTNSLLSAANSCNTVCSSASSNSNRGGGGSTITSRKTEERFQQLQEVEGGDGKKCGCTCLIDAFSISDDEVYSYMEEFMVSASAKFQGAEFISYDEEARHPYGFTQGNERLSEYKNIFLMRYLIKIGCEPGSVGYMSTLASPLDPVFWVIHAMFEKAMHLLLLSPKYSTVYDFEWVSGKCPGSAYTDKLPFTEAGLGLGAGTTFMTNEQILEVMRPQNPALPYVYEDFTIWGTMNDSSSWDPYSS